MSDDRSYYAERANQERRFAMAAADQNTRRIHLEMASKYAALAGICLTDDTSDEPEQQTR